MKSYKIVILALCAALLLALGALALNVRGALAQNEFLADVAAGEAASVQAAIAAGADPNGWVLDRTQEGFAPRALWRRAVFNAATRIRRLSCPPGGCPPLWLNSDGVTALDMAMERADPAMARLLLQAGGKAGASAQTDLIQAITLRDPLLVQIFLDAGAPRPAAGPDQHGLLAIAALMAGDPRPAPQFEGEDASSEPPMKTITVQLLAAREPADAPGPGGVTALQLAVERDRADIARLLLESGADQTRTDDAGRSARDRARTDAMLQLLDRFQK